LNATRCGKEPIHIDNGRETVDADGFRQFTERTFATDRNSIPKGMLEVVP